MENFFRTNLLFLRQKNGKTQADIGLAVEKKANTVGYWEKGDYEPNITEVGKIAQFFDIDPVDLLYKDLRNVHPNQSGPENLNAENVHQNVHPTVHLTTEKKQSGQFYGTMPKVITIDTSGEENAVFVPVRARAGYLVGYGDPEYISKLEAIRILGGTRHRTYRIFEIEGNSMFNTFSDRDRVNAYWVSISEIRDDRVYVVVTKNDGMLIKRVINRYQDGKIICTSDNNHRGEYPPVIVDVHDIAEVWYVEERSTRQLGRPGELYKRMVDVEAKTILLEQELKSIRNALPKS